MSTKINIRYITVKKENSNVKKNHNICQTTSMLRN